MPYYRLYFLEPGTLKIKAVDDFNAPSDESAIALCETRRGHRPMELWCQARKVTTFDATPAVTFDPGEQDD